jgi:hypothetical protein
MVARKKFLKVEIPQNQLLRNEIEQVALSHKQVEALYKDIHLIDAAVQLDNIVISCDQYLRDILEQVSGEVTVMKDVMYANPVSQTQEIIVWLQEGAGSEKKWCKVFKIGYSD